MDIKREEFRKELMKLFSTNEQAEILKVWNGDILIRKSAISKDYVYDLAVGGKSISYLISDELRVEVDRVFNSIYNCN